MFGAWVASVLSTATVAVAAPLAAAWLARKWIATRLEASIRLGTEKQLAEFTHRLDAAEARISAVRDAGIETNLQLSAVVLAERVAAIKAIWKGVVDWRRATMVTMFVSAITTEYVRRNAGNAGLIQPTRQLLQACDHSEIMKAANNLQYWRPFVTERAWAMFTAYHSFYALRMTRATALTLQQPELAIRLWETDNESKIVRESAPQLATQYEANPIAMTPKFLGFVESELLAELQKSLAGEHSGVEATRQAVAIVAATQLALTEAELPPTLP